MMRWNMKNINYSHKATSIQVYQLLDRKLTKFPSHETEINICGMPKSRLSPPK